MIGAVIILDTQLSKIVHATYSGAGQTCGNSNMQLSSSIDDPEVIEGE